MSLEGARVVIVGASRGFGKSLAKIVAGAKPSSLCLVARDEIALLALKAELQAEVRGLNISIAVQDFAKPCASEDLLNHVLTQGPIDELFYCAGGGCHGLFAEQKIKAHQWTLRVNLLAPMELIHAALQLPHSPRNLVVLGSALAERGVEPLGASYTAAKAGLRSLIQSINAGSGHKRMKLHLFSPGFLDTQLVPERSWPRALAGLVDPPELSAKEMLRRVYPGSNLG